MTCKEKLDKTIQRAEAIKRPNEMRRDETTRAQMRYKKPEMRVQLR